MPKKTESIIILVLAAAVVVLAYLYFAAAPVLTRGLSAKEAGEAALGFINEYMIEGGLEAELKGDVTEESGLYKFTIQVGGQEISPYITKDGTLLFPQGGIDLEEATRQIAEEESSPVVNRSDTLGGFSVTGDEVCLEDDKPIVYFFGANWCPHCQWEHPVVESVVEKFEGHISFHNNMDSEEDDDVFAKYSPGGGIPAVVIGCKYSRVGSGESSGEEAEMDNLTALICDVTNNQPAEACSEVEDLLIENQ